LIGKEKPASTLADTGKVAGGKPRDRETLPSRTGNMQASVRHLAYLINAPPLEGSQPRGYGSLALHYPGAADQFIQDVNSLTGAIVSPASYTGRATS
jgi:hypothetical protein